MPARVWDGRVEVAPNGAWVLLGDCGQFLSGEVSLHAVILANVIR